MTNFTYIIGRNSFKNKSIFIIFRKKDFGNNITKVFFIISQTFYIFATDIISINSIKL